MPGVTLVPPTTIDLANPEGQEFDLIWALGLAAVAALNTF